MFIEYKTGNIEENLKILAMVSTKLLTNNYNRKLTDIVSNCSKYKTKYSYTYHNGKLELITYEFNIKNITYGIEETHGLDNFIYIKVNDIVIFHNRSDFSCNGMFDGISSGWNHILPKEMLLQIKQDSKAIKNYIKEIKKYIKTYDTVGNEKWYKEHKELEEIFCKK